MTELNRQVGKELQRLRKARKITQRQIAERLHKTTACVSKYESGDIAMDIENFCDYCAVLHVSPADLLSPFLPDEYEQVRPATPPPSFYDVPALFLYWCGGVDGSIFSAKVTISPHTFAASMHMMFDFYSKNDFFSASKAVFEGDIEFYSSITRLQLRKVTNPFDLITVTAYNAGEGNNYRIGHLSSLTSYYSPMSTKCIVSQEIIRKRDVVVDLLRISKDEIAQLRRSGVFLPLNIYKKNPEQA